MCRLQIVYSELYDIEEVEPEEDEKMIIDDYIEGKDEYQPAITHSELLKELNL